MLIVKLWIVNLLILQPISESWWGIWTQSKNDEKPTLVQLGSPSNEDHQKARIFSEWFDSVSTFFCYFDLDRNIDTFYPCHPMDWRILTCHKPSSLFPPSPLPSPPGMAVNMWVRMLEGLICYVFSFHCTPQVNKPMNCSYYAIDSVLHYYCSIAFPFIIEKESLSGLPTWLFVIEKDCWMDFLPGPVTTLHNFH